ncbi:hypothetical protein JL100_010425 [Skermanella mucosa]|uniref:hypothetical protein n=1 Tax=Skermanella mucosa TaxID=1789672 RepID=UPI00192ABF33|nr:hypothetical protein [Skermanella mucosa]UEM23130.1 hypothetical protein JL100_010425 [Skermanella mucosa]
MSDWTDQILDAIQRVSILDYRKDETTGQPRNVGEQTAAMIFNAVRAAERRAIDPAEDWQIRGSYQRPVPYALTMGETLNGRPSVRLTSTVAASEAIALDTPEQIDELIARLRRARATLVADQLRQFDVSIEGK